MNEVTLGHPYLKPPESLRPHKEAKLIPPLCDKARDLLFRDVARCREVRNPIMVLPDGTVIDGHHRLEAAKAAKLKTVPVIFVEPPPFGVEFEMVRYALMQRSLTSEQRIDLARIGNEYRDAAKRAKGEEIERGQVSQPESVIRNEDVSPKQVASERREVAQQTGLSERTVKRLDAKRLKEATGDDDRVDAASLNSFQRRLDAAGGIPPALAEFAANAAHTGLVDVLRAVRGQVDGLETVLIELGISDLPLGTMRTAADSIEADSPWSACPCQRGHDTGKPCRLCHGKLWREKRYYDDDQTHFPEQA